MNQQINFARATMATTDLLEALMALKHDAKFKAVHRESVEEAFSDLARELGFAVNAPDGEENEPVVDPAVFRSRRDMPLSYETPISVLELARGLVLTSAGK